MSATARRLVLVLAVAGLLGACAAVDTIDYRYDTTNRSTERARDQSILLNIVRASHNAPLNFVAISRVSGTTSASGSLALPTFLIGPTGAFADPIGRAVVFDPRNAGATASASGSYDLTVLESKDFYNALLSPVDLPTLSYFERQGYSRELLFWLFADSVRETAHGRTVEYRNDVGDDVACATGVGRARCFKDMVDVAVATGLTAQTKTVPDPGNPKGQHLVYGRLCFDPVLAERARRDYAGDMFRQSLVARHRPRCSEAWRLPSHTTDTLTFDLVDTPGGVVHYEIISRSTFGIYQFLGSILANQATDQLVMRGPRGSFEDQRIMALASGPGCFSQVIYEGRIYCVPVDGAENTKRIFSLLVQLLALKTQSADLAITPAVRVTP